MAGVYYIKIQREKRSDDQYYLCIPPNEIPDEEARSLLESAIGLKTTKYDIIGLESDLDKSEQLGYMLEAVISLKQEDLSLLIEEIKLKGFNNCNDDEKLGAYRLDIGRKDINSDMIYAKEVMFQDENFDPLKEHIEYIRGNIGILDEKINVDYTYDYLVVIHYYEESKKKKIIHEGGAISYELDLDD